ncbi:MAG: hypothetical protein HC882_07400 [Acidobacteria bacterium]|nr:hypothetical protein [Acidobacteriota bacterium]
MKRTLRSPKSRTSSIVLLVLSLTMALSAATPKAAADESTGKDPVVQDVIRMLAAGVEPTLVEQWLVRNKVRPKHVSADDLIELTKVKAPGSLVDLLMRMAAGEIPAAAVPAPAPGASAAPASTTAPRRRHPRWCHRVAGCRRLPPRWRTLHPRNEATSRPHSRSTTSPRATNSNRPGRSSST